MPSLWTSTDRGVAFGAVLRHIRHRAPLLAVLIAGGLTGFARGQSTTLVSINPSGDPSDHHSGLCSISADGRYVVFESLADNLVEDDANEVMDIFVHDRWTGEIVRMSVDSDGFEANLGSYVPSISADGRYVVFESQSDNLALDDTNELVDVFLRDRDTDANGLFDETDGVSTVRVSVSSSGEEGSGESQFADISADGRYVVFQSWSNDLVDDDSNSFADIFVRDIQQGATTRISMHSNGTPANALSVRSTISADGRYVAFESLADNLVASDGNAAMDVFVHNRDSGETTRVSIDSEGHEASAASLDPSTSADGRWVAFTSFADDLVPNDGNGRQDVFVHDRESGLTARISVSSAGEEGNLDSFAPFISADAGSIVFQSDADTLVANDANDVTDVFVHDMDSSLTGRASVDSNGTEGNGYSVFPSISGDGQFVAFGSLADNLVAEDANTFEDIFVRDRSSCPDSPPGDFTLDGLTDSADVPAMVQALLDGPPWTGEQICAGDFNADSMLDGDDLVGFIQQLGW